MPNIEQEQPNQSEQENNMPDSEEEKTDAEPGLEVGTKASIVTASGERIDGCKIVEYREGNDSVKIEFPDGGDGVMKREEFLQAVDKAKQETGEEPGLVELGSRDLSQYKTGDRYDKEDYHGVVKKVDFKNSTISIELDKQDDQA